MPDYKKAGFKKNFSRSGPPRRDFDGPKKLYKAECSNCHDACEVPFRPNGMKPVFCRNCFQRDEAPRDSRDFRDSRPAFGKKDYAPRPSLAPRTPEPDRRIDDLKRQLTMMESKLDHLARLIESTSKAPAPAPKKAVPAKKPKKAAKKA